MNNKQARQPRQDLFTSAMGGGTIRRASDLALVTFRDAALITTSEELRRAQQWGRARDASANEHDDRLTLLQQLDTMIARAGTAEPTRGEPATIVRLVRKMHESGMNMAEWKIPQPVRDLLLAAQATGSA
ncbi:hypothetical protein [Solimonas soli]|uniref:hypothetical protein n=1 Tax=Solimonas soli TaxID=413479 RepID=UPI000482760F|nr:hypothetical protein [Solimonas soli]